MLPSSTGMLSPLLCKLSVKVCRMFVVVCNASTILYVAHYSRMVTCFLSNVVIQGQLFYYVTIIIIKKYSFAMM